MRRGSRDSDASYASNRPSTASHGGAGRQLNITDHSFKQSALRRVNAYLSSHNSPYSLVLKPLPSNRDIFETLKFILSRLEFSCNKLEDDLQVILKQLNCPHKLNRSALKAPGTPHSFPPVLAVIHWLVQIADYKDHLSPKENSGAAFTATSDSLSRSSHTSHAYQLFLRLPHRNSYVYNSMIKGFADTNQPKKALSVYQQMLRNGFLPNNYTFSFLIRASIDLSFLSFGLILHAQATKLGWDSYDFVQNGLVHLYAVCDVVGDARKVFDKSSNRDVFTWTAIINGYLKSDQVEVARELFDEMPVRNVVTWSTMITGFAQMGFFKEALELFSDMQLAGIQPNHAAIVGALTACAFLGALDQGRWIHAYINKNGIELDTKLGTAIVDMYAKCGCIELATIVFENIPHKDVFAYTSLISGLSNNGHSLRSIELFKRMQDERISPNQVTFLCVLSACSRIGHVEEGLRIFKSMKDKYNIESRNEHYGCMVDLLGRAGLLNDAEEIVRQMPGEPDSYVLGALLNACRIHGAVELGEEMVKRLIKQKLDHGGVHTLLSNIYATAEQWDGVEKVRKEMGDKMVRKMPGCSLIEVDGVACEFGAGQKNSTFLLVDDYGKTAMEVASSEGKHQRL